MRLYQCPQCQAVYQHDQSAHHTCPPNRVGRHWAPALLWVRRARRLPDATRDGGAGR